MSDVTSPFTNACTKHPGVTGPFSCTRCGKYFCIECCYSLADGTISCHDCYAQAQAAPAIGTAPTPGVFRVSVAPRATTTYEDHALPGQGCIQHPTVNAPYKCDFCGARSCLTCDFYFLPNTHACPQCAAASSGQLSPARKKNMMWALITAGIASVVMVIFFSGVLNLERGMGAILAEVLFRLILFPAAIGAGLAMAAFRKGRSNHIGIWLALIWNFVLMIGVFSLSVIGLFSHGGE